MGATYVTWRIEFVDAGGGQLQMKLYEGTVLRYTSAAFDAPTSQAWRIVIGGVTALINGILKARNNPRGDTVSSGFTINAIIPGKARWVSPADGEPLTPQPTLTFSMDFPVTGTAHAEIQLDTNSGFPAPIIYRSWPDPSGWEYWNGNAWTAWPATGVPNVYAGNHGRFTVPVPLESVTYYRRVRSGST